ncbi:MAG: hypothetical protein JO336_12710, partial [Acidobacteriia bacterium]|nr:hypothetical protein [Terriglobia bacterium]
MPKTGASQQAATLSERCSLDNYHPKGVWEGRAAHVQMTAKIDGSKSFVFLACTIRKKRSVQRNPRRYYMQRWPSPQATKKIRTRVRGLTSSRRSGHNVKQIIAKLNPVLRGWENYFRMRRRGGQRVGRVEQWTRDRFVEMG